MRRIVVFIALVLVEFGGLGGLAGSVARADTPSEADTQAAKIHYQAGEQYYLRGHYQEAIAEFKEAYRLSQAAALLYNMSQASDRLGDLPHAREYLQKYLDTGQADPSEVQALRDKLKALDKRIAETQPAPDQGKPLPDATPPTEPRSTAPPLAPAAPVGAEASRPWKTWKWVAAGTGAGCLVLALLFAADANNMAKKLEDASKSQPQYLGDLPDDYTRGQRDEKLAIGFGIAGGVLAAAGAVFFFIDARAGSEKPPQARIAPILAPGTAGASAVWRF